MIKRILKLIFFGWIVAGMFLAPMLPIEIALALMGIPLVACVIFYVITGEYLIDRIERYLG